MQGLAGQRVLALLEGELKRHGQALMGKLEVGPGDSESARGWPDSVQAWRCSERRQPWCVSSSQLRLYRQPKKMRMWLRRCGLHP